MIEIIKGRYGYTAEDGTVQIAEKGKRLSLDEKEEKRLVRLGCAEAVEVKKTPRESPMPRKRKGRKE